MRLALVARGITVVLLAAFSAALQAELLVQQGFVRGLPPGQPNTAAFMTLVNSGDQDLKLQEVSSEAASSAEVHISRHQNGMMTMQRIDQLVVPAGGKVVLEPGARHLMLLGLRQPLSEGDDVNLQFRFTDGTQAAATLKVRSVLSESAHQHHH